MSAGLTGPQLRALRFYAAPYGAERVRMGMPRRDVIDRLAEAGLVQRHPCQSWSYVITADGRARLAEIDAAGGAQ